MKVLLLATMAATLAAAAMAATPETPAQIRRIVAQSVCLAVAYPDNSVARDNEAVYALYAPLLSVKEPLEARRKVEKMAQAAQPAAPSPAGGHNLALAKCALFAERLDVLTALGASTPRQR
jgi:hypothetical protein